MGPPRGPRSLGLEGPGMPGFAEAAWVGGRIVQAWIMLQAYTLPYLHTSATVGTKD